MAWIDNTKTITKEEKIAQEAEEILKDKKDIRADAVASTTVTITSGKQFDGDEMSQSRMCRAIAASNPGESTMWVLADNTSAVVTHEELKEALRLSLEAQATVWFIY